MCLLVGSLFPDVDLIYAYLIQHGHVHHHRLFTHVPFFWACLALALPLLGRHRRAAAAFLAGVALHLCLDSVVGDIMWAWPFSETFFHVVRVPHRFDLWWLSFFTHWTFAIELAICAAAALVLRSKRAGVSRCLVTRSTER